MSRPEAERRVIDAARDVCACINRGCDKRDDPCFVGNFQELWDAFASLDALPADDGSTETPAKEIARLQREIGARQSRLQFLVLGDQRKSFHVPIGSPPDDGGHNG